MPLFQVEGWDLKTTKVSFDNASSKPSKKKDKKKRAKASKNGNDSTLQTTSRSEPVETEQYSSTAVAVPSVEENTRKNNKKRKIQEDEDTEQNVQLDVKKPLTALQKKMLAKLSGSRFRWINEQLYTISSDEALRLVKKQPEVFDEYHEGFRSQVQSWPENPVNVFVSEIERRSKRPVNAPGGLPGLSDSKKIVISDMGCGEAQLALDVSNFFKRHNKKAKKHHQKKCEVHSFDLKKVNERITVADIKHVPLKDESCTVVVFCLALMGTNFLDFIEEAYRILAPRGELWIAEIKSRFADGKGEEFVDALKLLGFFHKTTDDTNKMFTRFEFFKPPREIIEERKAKLERKQKFIEVETQKETLQKRRNKQAEGEWLLKPCIYKRR
ncbi:LAMI_0H11848g1_1 [Lachancea mirantina]|uniref:Ribosomal RNA-processing protein 8 n=1 Tax=Lachancea mirantina TaxID=1230905 RepID=A0A1G4KH91_9SACH|nr:LAMI_0H11848g1_1 [Lachancea mirantina]